MAEVRKQKADDTELRTDDKQSASSSSFYQLSSVF
jgi:hypothetical protein